MVNTRCIFVEKKSGFDVEAKSLLQDFRSNLRLHGLNDVRLVNKYTLGEIDEAYYQKALYTIFSERTVDTVYEGNLPIANGEFAFAVEYLPGQYDQRADSAGECYQLLTAEDKLEVKSAKVVIISGDLSLEDVDKIKSYYINPVDSREVALDNLDLKVELPTPKDVEILNGFIAKSNGD
ncbi:MAG: phosphoribosylformylglycinamidine synthase, partial [Clostridium sp.]